MWPLASVIRSWLDHLPVMMLELIQGTCRLTSKMGRGDEQNLCCNVSDGNHYWLQTSRNTTSPKQWYLDALDIECWLNIMEVKGWGKDILHISELLNLTDQNFSEKKILPKLNRYSLKLMHVLKSVDTDQVGGGHNQPSLWTLKMIEKTNEIFFTLCH